MNYRVLADAHNDDGALRNPLQEGFIGDTPIHTMANLSGFLEEEIPETLLLPIAAPTGTQRPQSGNPSARL
jgi:hypothetical protein